MPVVSEVVSSIPDPARLKAQRNKKRFQDVFPAIKADLIEFLRTQHMPSEAIGWFQRNLDHNVPGGKLNRGVSVVDTVEILLGGPLDEVTYHKAAVLGWCVELLQAYFLVADDMMDASYTRRGQPCWFRMPGVSNIAINDSFMLEAAIYHLLKKYFRSEPYYVYLLELFHETTFQTEMGQLIDLITAPEDHVDLSKFSLEKHELIVIYKTAYYSFYLPVALAMRFCGISSESAYNTALSILLPLGTYFQVQDDYLDCYGSPAVIGKIGTDILDNKCSWNINIALALCTPAQRKVLDENYGRKSTECEQRVKEIFDQVDIRQRYEAFEQDAYTRILSLIETIPETSSSNSAYANGNGVHVNGNGMHSNGAKTNGHAPTEVPLRREVFRSFLDKIYKRSK